LKAKKRLFQNPILWVFFISFVYWFYLVLTTHMAISCDAIGYESLGRTLAGKGWLDYFLNGPSREPFYPLLVSISMRIGTFFSFPYQAVQVFLQLLLFFITQLLMLRILRILGINDWISACMILYLGVSPAIVNSAFSLFSEIATYPLILVVILLMYQSWISFSNAKVRVSLLAIISGLTFALLVLTKGIFEFIAPVFIGLFFLGSLFTRNRKFILNALMYFVIILVVFYALITGYKLTNKALNGNFVITNRGAIVLYGGAALRTEPLTRERLLTAIAYIPGGGVCEAIFGKEKCYFWSIAKFDELGYTKVGELTANGLRPEEVDKEISRVVFKKVLQNPWKFSLFWFVESLKMIFWESTQIGFVSYSEGLTRLFSWPPLKNGLRLLVAILTFAGLIYLGSFLVRERKSIIEPRESNKIMLFLVAMFIFLFTSAYALCMIITRYAFPIVPLYLIIIAFAIQKIIFH
jgi:hypothetical protein